MLHVCRYAYGVKMQNAMYHPYIPEEDDGSQGPIMMLHIYFKIRNNRPWTKVPGDKYFETIVRGSAR